MDCPSYIKVAASAVDQVLRVTGLEGTHKGHLFSQKVCDYLPQNRKLDKNETNFAKICLSVRGNKKFIQNKIHLSTGKKTTLKDLANMAYQMKNTSNDLQNVVKTLKETFGCSVDVLHGEDNFFKGLYFSTKTMRSAVAAWPSFISIDGTYKLLNIGCTVFIFLVEDSEGQSEIVGVALTCTEDAITFEWLLNRFKTENNIKDGDVKCIMADKDLLQRDVIKKVFPGVSVYICLFHTLKIMKREISCDKMKITKTERETALTLVQKLVYSMNESQYNENYEVLKSAVTSKVFDYIEKNWHPIRTEWTVYSMKNENLLNRTTIDSSL